MGRNPVPDGLRSGLWGMLSWSCVGWYCGGLSSGREALWALSILCWRATGDIGGELDCDSGGVEGNISKDSDDELASGLE